MMILPMTVPLTGVCWTTHHDTLNTHPYRQNKVLLGPVFVLLPVTYKQRRIEKWPFPASKGDGLLRANGTLYATTTLAHTLSITISFSFHSILAFFSLISE